MMCVAWAMGLNLSQFLGLGVEGLGYRAMGLNLSHFLSVS